MRSLLTRLLILALFTTPTSWAQQQPETSPHPNERDYIVELLVFAQKPGEGATEQPGPAQFFEPLEEAAYRLGPSPFWSQLSPKPLPIYQPRDIRLVRTAAALERSDDYRLLFHAAWQMPVVGEDRTLPLLLEAGDYYGDQPELMGQLRLSVARYLHLETDLYLHQFIPLDQDDPSSPLSQLRQSSFGLQEGASQDKGQDGELIRLVEQQYQIEQSAQMQQRRRMRSGELHFIDSPYLGLLVRIERAPES